MELVFRYHRGDYRLRSIGFAGNGFVKYSFRGQRGVEEIFMFPVNIKDLLGSKMNSKDEDSSFLEFIFSSRKKQFSKGLPSIRGSALAEFALALPVLVVFVTLTHQVWNTIEVHKALDDTAREAARFASLQIPPMATITPAVQQYVANTLVPNSKLKAYDPSKITVGVERLGSTPGTPEDTVPKGTVNPGDVLRVSVGLAANQPGGFYSYLFPSASSIVRSASYVQANPVTGVPEPTPTPSGPGCCATDEFGNCIELCCEPPDC
ncbi:MAG: pilus assembly protein [Candidatus Omnitrophica bacterium]|nr:pilus assembly protein [Candidatus Omnitrophota bacterium]